MKTIIVQGSPEAQHLIKVMQKKCDKRVQIPYHVFEKEFNLTDPTSWKYVIALFYLFGAQRYSGNRTAQNPVTICEKGARRIIEILANFGQNEKLGYLEHGPNTIEAHVEAYYINALLTTETVDSVISAWSKIMKPWGYEVVKMFENEKDFFTKIVIRRKAKTNNLFPASDGYYEAQENEENK